MDQPRKRRKRATKKEFESIAELHEQIADLQEQLQAARRSNKDSRSESLVPERSTPEHIPAGPTVSDKQSPPFISKVDLEEEMSNLCEENINFAEIFEEIRVVSSKRQQLLQKDRMKDAISAGIISVDAARQRLQLYREKLYPAHPLVEIEDSVTVEMLIRDQPFLFNAIMTTTTILVEDARDQDMSLTLENHAMEGIVNEVMVAGTKSVELLKALILLSLWYNSPEFFKLRRYHIFNCVAVTLLHDLGIFNRSSVTFSSDAKLIHKNDENYKSLEYRSLILILYFSTVSICLILRRTVFVRWTPYVNESCEVLEQMGEQKYRTLAMFLRLNHQLERMHNLIHSHEYAEKPRLSKYIRAEFQTNLAIIKARMSPDDHRHLAYYYSVEAYLYQPALPDVQWAGTNVGNFPKLDSGTLSAIAHCTASCLFALDEFAKLLATEIAGLPLFYSSRIIYTAGILLRLRYLILSLPSHIEKEMVPKYAILTIQKLSKQFREAQSKFPCNFFLKKMGIILQLFIQTYVTQVMDLLKKNDGYTSTSFKSPPISIADRDDLVHVATTLQGVTGNLITDPQGPSTTTLPLDLLSFAAAAFRNNSEQKEPNKPEEKKEVQHPLSKGFPPDRPGTAPNLPVPMHFPQQTPAPPWYGSGSFHGGVPSPISRNDDRRKVPIVNPNVSSTSVLTGPTLEGYLVGPHNSVNEAMNSMEPELTSQGNSFFNIDDEFWSNLLSTDSNKFHFAQSEPLHTDNVLYQNAI